MARWFAVNHTHFSMAAVAARFVVLTALMVSTSPAPLQAQGPALTTISGTVYRAD